MPVSNPGISQRKDVKGLVFFFHGVLFASIHVKRYICIIWVSMATASGMIYE